MKLQSASKRALTPRPFFLGSRELRWLLSRSLTNPPLTNVRREDHTLGTVLTPEPARSNLCASRQALWGPLRSLRAANRSLGTFATLIAIAWLQHPGLATAANSDARIVLHAQPYAAGNNCSTPQQALGLNCDSVRPTVTVTPGQAVEIYVYLHSYDSLAGAQMAFTWPASWTFVYWVGSCQAHELLAVPAPQASGGSYVGAFDPITGGQLQPLGRLRFVAGSAGTQFTVTETWAPGGTGVINNQLAFTAIPVAHRGIVAVGAPGLDSCGGKSESSALFEE